MCLLEKFDDLAKRFKAEFDEIIEGERAKLKAEMEAFEAEKEMMKALDVSDDDIIFLNVGGQKYTTTRSTLCQVEGSLLAAMFSGRWESKLKRDQDGVVFFDFNPHYFGYVMDYLRAKRIATPENPAPLPKVPEDQMKNFNNLVEYLGLKDEFGPTEIPTEIAVSEKFNLRSSGVNLQDDGKVAVHYSTHQGHQYVLGENVYSQGIVRHKLKLESFQDNHWIMVGMVKADVVPQNNGSFFWHESKAWALGKNGNQGKYENGSLTQNSLLQNVTRQGDTVELVLDCEAGKLSLHLPTGQQFHMDVPKSQSWRLHVNLNGANDRIRIMEVLQA